jgi:hypothetical protein
MFTISNILSTASIPLKSDNINFTILIKICSTSPRSATTVTDILTSDGIGAYVTFRESGTDTILCSMEIGVFNSSYQNLVAHCGLGDATKVDATVRHANGGPVHEFVNLDVNRNVIFRINGEIVKNYIPGSGAPLLAQADGTESEIPDEPEDNTRLLELQNERQLLLERLSDLQDILESLEMDIEELENQ